MKQKRQLSQALFSNSACIWALAIEFNWCEICLFARSTNWNRCFYWTTNWIQKACNSLEIKNMRLWFNWYSREPNLDPVLFYWHAHNELHSLNTVHVDDICWSGTYLIKMLKKLKKLRILVKLTGWLLRQVQIYYLIVVN